jgi:acetoin utilization deacetylase AcuC-like enzyme
MATAYLSHPLFLQHEMGAHHPESPERLMVIEQQLIARGLYDRLLHQCAPAASREAILQVHHPDYLQALEQASPTEGYQSLDPDTAMNPYSLQAATHAAGAAIRAVELVMSSEVSNAFCAVRPPGHHAEPGHAMGFCLFNNVAIAVAHALEQYSLERIAIIDFDVHHGNGTETAFNGNDRVLLCSSFQHPFYPGTRLNQAASNILHAPLRAGDGSDAFRTLYTERILPAVEVFAPQMIFISAGFDGHREDDMSGLKLVDEDYIWVSEQVAALASRYASGRIVSLLEGGYALQALGRCATHHIATLLKAGAQPEAGSP